MERVEIFLRGGKSFVITAQKITVTLDDDMQLSQIHFLEPVGRTVEFMSGAAVEAVVRLPKGVV